MSNPSYAFRYPSVGPFAALWNVAINPTEPSFYASQLNADGSVELFVSGPPVTLGTGCGALLKGITSSLPSVPFTTLTTSLTVLVDDSPARQWIEIDTRLTTPTDGSTYPGDLDIGLDGTVRGGGYCGGVARDGGQGASIRPLRGCTDLDPQILRLRQKDFKAGQHRSEWRDLCHQRNLRRPQHRLD